MTSWISAGSDGKAPENERRKIMVRSQTSSHSDPNLRRIKLMIMSGPEDGREFIIDKEHFTLGSSEADDVCFRYDPEIQTGHLRAQVSSNGVILTDPKQGEENLVSFGDLYRLGQTWFAVQPL